MSRTFHLKVSFSTIRNPWIQLTKSPGAEIGSLGSGCCVPHRCGRFIDPRGLQWASSSVARFLKQTLLFSHVFFSLVFWSMTLWAAMMGWWFLHWHSTWARLYCTTFVCDTSRTPLEGCWTNSKSASILQMGGDGREGGSWPGQYLHRHWHADLDLSEACHRIAIWTQLFQTTMAWNRSFSHEKGPRWSTEIHTNCQPRFHFEESLSKHSWTLWPRDYAAVQALGCQSSEPGTCFQQL